MPAFLRRHSLLAKCLRKDRLREASSAWLQLLKTGDHGRRHAPSWVVCRRHEEGTTHARFYIQPSQLDSGSDVVLELRAAQRLCGGRSAAEPGMVKFGSGEKRGHKQNVV